MRILHVIAQKPGETGSGIFLKNLIKIGAQKQYKQYVIAGIAVGEDKYSRAMPEEVIFCPVYFESPDLPFPVVGMSDVMPYKSTKYSELTEEMLKMWMKAFKLELEKAKLFKPDIIIMHHLWILAALTRETFSSTPMIGICHGTELRQLCNTTKYSDYVMEGCKKIEAIAALSPFQKKVIGEVYRIDEERIVVTGAGFDSDIFYPAKKRLDNTVIKIIYAGKLSLAKGIPDLILAVSKLSVNKDSIELLLVGSASGADMERIEALIEECPYKVRVMGAVSQNQLGEILRQCHIFVLPSFYEGLSLVTIEALASGLRVVANDLPGMREWIGKELEEKGIIEYVKMPKLIDADIPIKAELHGYHLRLMESIVKQIEAINQEAPCPHPYSKYVHKFSWDAVFDSIENIYSELICNR